MSTLTAKKSLITHLDPFSPVADRYRVLRNWIEGTAGSVKVLGITSAEPLAGKSTTAANLAVAFAQAGRKVLLADGNLHRPALHLFFSESNHLGLANMLLQQMPLQDVVKDVGIGHLALLPPGPITTAAVDPLRSGSLRPLLEEASNEYDRVIVDMPAVLSAADASTLAFACDGVLMVVHAATSRKRRVLEACTRLRQLEVPIIGCVLNGTRSAGQTGYRHYVPFRRR